MAYLLDSDVVIDHLERAGTATRLLDQLAANGLAISVVTYMEAYEGILRSAEPQAIQVELDALLEQVRIIPFTSIIARRCAHLRHALRQQGRRVRPRALDLIVATTAQHYGLTLVTRNINDYQDIPELRLYHPQEF